MHPRTSCRANGRTRNAVSSMSIWVCTRPNYFYCPSPDFTTSTVSQSVTNNRCAPSCGGTREKWGVFGIVPPPTCKLLPTPLVDFSLQTTPTISEVLRCRSPSHDVGRPISDAKRYADEMSINQSINQSFIRS